MGLLCVQAMNLSSELEKVKSEYERLMEELQALSVVKEERSRHVNTEKVFSDTPFGSP